LEETILHYLRGVPSVDSRLLSFTTPMNVNITDLSDSQKDSIDRVCNTITRTSKSPSVIQLIGPDSTESLRFAKGIAESLRWNLFEMNLEALPTSTMDLEELSQLWQRDSRLFGLVLLFDSHESSRSTEPASTSRMLRLLASVHTPTIVITRERLSPAGENDLCIDIACPSVKEQFTMWKRLLRDDCSDSLQLSGELSRQFSLDPSTADEAIAAVKRQKDPNTAARFRRHLWRECRERTRPRLEGLAQRIDVKAKWSDLVLSPDRESLLTQLRDQVQSRWRVYDDWGMADRMNRGLGISALFAGESGTGKTMAAEVVANDLDLDLYRVDLSSVVNKYIGETEKHLRRLFDAFESCGAILFFDECDALFGKRSEVKDSHDRYANIETNYLLQRLETYRGLAILATNNRAALDTAFLRRLRFVVTFAMPTNEERFEIWRKLLPVGSERANEPRIPVMSLDYERLAQFQLSGGSIQNVVLNAAFRAASRPKNNRITMRDVLDAVKDETVKLERPINESDFRVNETEVEEAVA